VECVNKLKRKGQKVEAQQFKRFRGARIVPIVRPEAASYIVADLQRSATIDDEAVLTAPYRFGAAFSVLALGETKALLETVLLDMTDHIGHKALLENVYLQIGEQYVCAPINVPLSPGPTGSYRTIELKDHRLSVRLDRYTRDVNGKILNVIDPFTAAGIVITVEAQVAGRVNLHLGDTCFYASQIGEGAFQFPDTPALADDDIRKKIRDDLVQIVLADVMLVGYDLDIDRLNALRAPRYVSQENLQVDAADTLAARYRTSPEYHPV
jgi:hypothetical protein